MFQVRTSEWGNTHAQVDFGADDFMVSVHIDASHYGTGDAYGYTIVTHPDMRQSGEGFGAFIPSSYRRRGGPDDLVGFAAIVQGF